MGRGAWRATVHVVTKTEQLTNKFLELEMVTHSSILPWKSHGQRSLAGYSPWDHKESDRIERKHTHNQLFKMSAREAKSNKRNHCE